MTVTIQKTKPKAEVKSFSDAKLREAVDAAAHVSEELKALKAAVKAKEQTLKAHQKTIAERLGVDSPEAEYSAAGAEYGVQIGKEAHSRSITSMDRVAKLLNKVKDGLFMEVCKVNLTDLDKYLTEEEAAKVTVSTTNGKRVWKFFKKIDG